MESLLGTWRVCRGHMEDVWRGMEWLLGAQRENVLHMPSMYPPCTLCMPCLHLVTTLFPLCTPSNHSIPLPHPLHVLCAPFVYPSCALLAPSNYSIAPSMHLATIPYPPLHTLHGPINHSILPSVHLATFHTPLHTLHTSSVPNNYSISPLCTSPHTICVLSVHPPYT